MFFLNIIQWREINMLTYLFILYASTFSQSGKLGILGTIRHHFARMITYHSPIAWDYCFSM